MVDEIKNNTENEPPASAGNETGSDNNAGNGGSNASQPLVVEYNGEKITVPENFIDKETKTVNIAALVKSQEDLRKQIGSDESPKEGLYEINIPEDFKEFIEPDKESVLYKTACAWAKSHKISQKDFDELVSPYINELAAPFVASKEKLQNEDAKLDKIFGNRKQEVKERITNFFKNSSIANDTEALNEVALLTSTAAGVKVLHELITKNQGGMAMIGAAAGGSEELNEATLREMMKDPRYWRDHEPNYVNKITEGFKKLYPDK